MPETRYLVLAVAAASLAVTGLIAAIPGLAFAHRNPELHLALQTAEALIGFLVAYLVLGRFRRRRRWPEMLLGLALTVLALANLFFSAIPAVVGDEGVGPTWAALIARTAGAILFAAAALAPDREVRVHRREGVLIGLAVFVAFAGVWGVVQLVEDSLPLGVKAVAGESNRVHLDGHWAILSAQFLGFTLYAVAAAGFTRRYARTEDRLYSWLAAGAVLSAAARLNYFLFPSLFSEYVYTGDVFRLGFYLVILAAAASEIRSFWREAAASAALNERTRIAQDLHDGLAQELASILRNLRWLDPEDEFVARSTAAAERALAQARRAMAALADVPSMTLCQAIEQMVRAVGEREGQEVIFNADSDANADPAERDALVLIVAEALTNAARHGGADVVRVELSGRRPLSLRVTDSGCGFDPENVRSASGGMGLHFMRARAKGIGADLRIESSPGMGTSVEVTL